MSVAYWHVPAGLQYGCSTPAGATRDRRPNSCRRRVSVLGERGRSRAGPKKRTTGVDNDRACFLGADRVLTVSLDGVGSPIELSSRPQDLNELSPVRLVQLAAEFPDPARSQPQELHALLDHGHVVPAVGLGAQPLHRGNPAPNGLDRFSVPL